MYQFRISPLFFSHVGETYQTRNSGLQLKLYLCPLSSSAFYPYNYVHRQEQLPQGPKGEEEIVFLLRLLLGFSGAVEARAAGLQAQALMAVLLVPKEA